MKRFIFLALCFVSAAALGQSGTGIFSAIRSRVTDSTTVVTPPNYGILYYNQQSNKWRVRQNGAWSDLVGGSGTDAVSSITVTVSSAELLNIYSAAKLLLAAPGPGKFYQVLSIAIVYDYATAPYATDTNLVIQYATVSSFGTIGGLINQSSDKVIMPQIPLIGATDLTNVENQALYLSTASANPTAGGGTLKVNLTYKIVTF